MAILGLIFRVVYLASLVYLLVHYSLTFITPSISSDPQEQLARKKARNFEYFEEWDNVFYLVWMQPMNVWDSDRDFWVESIFLQYPDAQVVVLSNTLPPEFFRELMLKGYKIFTLPVTPELLLEYEWYVGPNTKAWLKNKSQYSGHAYYHIHLAQYISYVVLYKHGGTYLSDFLLLKPFPKDLEFIATKQENKTEEFAFEIDRKYFENHREYLNLWREQDIQLVSFFSSAMRFKKGRGFLLDAAESSFNIATYDPKCLNCIESKAITNSIQKYLSQVNEYFQILPPRIFFPISLKDVDLLFQTTHNSEIQILKTINAGWAIHCYGRPFSSLDFSTKSLLDIYSRMFNLEVGYPSRYTFLKSSPLVNLRAFSIYIASQLETNSFFSDNAVILRGGEGKIPTEFVMNVACKTGHFTGMGQPTQFQNLSLSLQATHRHVNSLFTSLTYFPVSSSKSSKPLQSELPDDYLYFYLSFSRKIGETKTKIPLHGKISVWVIEQSLTIIFEREGCVEDPSLVKESLFIGFPTIVIQICSTEKKDTITYNSLEIKKLGKPIKVDWIIVYSEKQLRKIEGGLAFVNTGYFLYDSQGFNLPNFPLPIHQFFRVFLLKSYDLMGGVIQTDITTHTGTIEELEEKIQVKEKDLYGSEPCQEADYFNGLLISRTSKIQGFKNFPIGSPLFFWEAKTNKLRTASCDVGDYFKSHKKT